MAQAAGNKSNRRRTHRARPLIDILTHHLVASAARFSAKSPLFALPVGNYNAFTNSPELVDSAPVQMEAQGDFEICSFVPFGDIPK